jgi:ubiquinone/menaquinone biosynthesis C-methylase UbiE
MAPTDQIERWSAFRAWLYSLFYRTPKSNLAVVEFAELTANDVLLDIGCGPGAALEHADPIGADVAGVDPSPSMVDRASQRVPQAEVKVGSAESIPFPDDRFTVVISVSSYHHWADQEAGLKEIIRVLTPGGRLVVAERKHKRDAGHGMNAQRADELASTLLRIGYADTGVDAIRAGRSEYLVVSGKTPNQVG